MLFKKKKKKTWKRRREHTKPLKKKILVCILAKRVLILALKFIYLAPLPKKIYKLTQEIQQIDNKKNLYKKKCSYPDNKKNLWTNHKFGLSKNNNNKSITNHSKKKKSQKPNNLYPNFSLSLESSILLSNDSTLI